MDIPKATVLIVDDEVDFLDIINSNLENRGYFCIVYSNPHKAMDDIQQELKYDIAFFDIGFPGKIGGEDLVRVSREYNPNVPVYSISGFGMNSGELSAIDERVASGLSLPNSRGIIVKDNNMIKNIEETIKRELRR